MLLLLAHLALADDGGFALLRNARHRADGDIVRNISFRGNGSVLGDSPDGLLRIQMEQEESPPFILTTPVTFAAKPAEWVPGALNRDAYRLELWYAHHGWFDARFEGWEVLQVRPARVRKSGALKAAGVVDVVGYMTPGSPTTVRHLAITGYDNNVGTVVRAVLSGLDLAEGDRFDLERVRLATDQLQAQLRERGFAFATATMSSEVFPDEHAVDVRIVIDMGSARTLSFGAITIDGLASVPEDKVRGALRLKEGQRYSLSAIEQARTRLFALGVFSSVTLDADMSDAHAERIPLAVHLTESKARTLRIGGGFQYDGVRFTPRVSSTFVHTNVAKRLVRVELEESLGYNRFTSTSRSLGSDDLLYGLRAAVSVPQFQHPKVDLSTAVTYDRDLQNGMFLYRNPQLDADVVWHASDATTFQLGPHWELYTMPALIEGQGSYEARMAGAAVFGRSFDGRYQLASIDANLTVDWRDDPTNTTRGSFWTAALRESVPLAAEDPLFVDVSAEARGYQPLDVPVLGRFVAVGRLKGRAVHAWNGGTVPYPERVFMGGPQDIRAFRRGYVGPYDLLCLYEPSTEGDPFSGEPQAGLQATQRYLSRGGVAGATTSFELRKTLLPAYSIGVQVFVDAGVLVTRMEDNAPLSVLPRWGYGGGVRQDTIIGPIRLDVALRPSVPEDSRPTQYVNCANEDKLARPYGFGTRDPATRLGEYSTLQSPVFQILLTLGDPI